MTPRSLLTLATVAIVLPIGGAVAQTRYSVRTVVDQDRTPPIALASCQDGTKTSEIQVWPDHLHYASGGGYMPPFDIPLAAPRRPDGSVDIPPITKTNRAGGIYTYSGQIAANGIPDIKVSDLKSSCTYRLKIL